MFSRRSDGRLVQNLSATRRFMPYLSGRRNSSLVYYTAEVDVGPALAFLEEQNRSRSSDRQITLFHIYLHCLALALHERPGVNRFVVGGRLWQREGIWITFSAKQALLDGAPVLTIKRKFDPNEPFMSLAEAMIDEIHLRRSGRRTTSDREIDWALRLPGGLISLGMGLLRLANRLGWLPRAMIESDPMFSSIFVANLGSVGLDAGYHHLWEYGTCSIFAVLGQIHARPDGAQVMNVKYSYDERIEDGLYAAIAIEGIKARLEDPSSLI